MNLRVFWLAASLAIGLSHSALAEDSGDLKIADNDFKYQDLQDPEAGLGSWSDPESLMGRIREQILEASIHDPALLQWFCGIDQKIKDGDIGLARYEPAKGHKSSSTAGLSDSDTAGVNHDQFTSLDSSIERDREILDAHLAEISHILVHELTHVANYDAEYAACIVEGPNGGETSECACHHAAAYANQLKFMLLLQAIDCIDHDSETERTYSILWNYGDFRSAHEGWLAARDHCLAGKAAELHDLDPLGDAPAVGGGTGLPPEYDNYDCGDIAHLFDGVEEAEDGSLSGGSDPDLDGDGNPCTSPDPEGDEESGSGGGE